MTKDANLKKVARRHALETGQRYTEARADLEGLRARVGWRRWSDDGRSLALHEPIAERLLAHLRDSCGVEPVTVSKISSHNDHVFAWTSETAVHGSPTCSPPPGQSPA